MSMWWAPFSTQALTTVSPKNLYYRPTDVQTQKNQSINAHPITLLKTGAGLIFSFIFSTASRLYAKVPHGY